MWSNNSYESEKLLIFQDSKDLLMSEEANLWNAQIILRFGFRWKRGKITASAVKTKR